MSIRIILPKILLALLVFYTTSCNLAYSQETTPNRPELIDEPLLTLQNQLKSPRQTVLTFLQAMKDNDFETAFACLDLSELESETANAKKRTYVIKLHLALNQFPNFFDLIAISGDADEPQQPYSVSKIGKWQKIQLVRGSNELWKFSRATVKLLDSDYFDFLIKDETADSLVAWSVPLWLKQKFPESWWGTTFLLKDYEWTCLLMLLIGGYLIALLVRYLSDYLTRLWFRLTETDVDDQPRKRLWTPIIWLLQIWIWYYGMTLIDLPSDVLSVVLPVLKFFTVLAAVWCAFRVIGVLQNYLNKKSRLTASRYDDSLVPVICSGLKLLSVILGVILFVDVFDKDWKTLLGGFGVVGIAVAIAAKDLLGNFFGSVAVLTDRPFDIGDWVIIDGKVEGTVENVGIRSSRVRTFHNSEIIVPNSLLTTAIVDNMGRRHFRRFKTHIKIKYNTPPEKIELFCEGMRELIHSNQNTENELAHVYVNEFGDSSIDILLYLFFDIADWGEELQERHNILMDILKLADQLGVEFAFPTRTLELEPTGDPVASRPINPSGMNRPTSGDDRN